eukprot:4722404-Pyramimonas_sp.AAC.1
MTAAVGTTGDSTAANASRRRDGERRQGEDVALAHRHLVAEDARACAPGAREQQAASIDEVLEEVSHRPPPSTPWAPGAWQAVSPPALPAF